VACFSSNTGAARAYPRASSRFYSSSAGLVTVVACFSSDAGAARAAREQPLLKSAFSPALELKHAAALTKPLLLSQSRRF
jgi:Flp pilus assembly protein protease CpaA